MIEYHLGDNLGRNGGVYACLDDVPKLLKLYKDDLTPAEFQAFQQRYRQRTKEAAGQMSLL